ncbi:MAG: ABC transporter substrate-binding protein [Anaerovoracaceae bacterium]
MKRVKKVLVVLAVLVLIFTSASCGGKDNGGDVIFNIATTQGYDTMNFFSTESDMVSDWLNICYDSLIGFDDDYNAVPRAAKDWESSEGGKTWTFYLRDDIYFSDGEQLTSADVKWTYENAADSYMYSTHSGGITSIECPDDFTVVFKCEEAKADMLYQSIPILPEHIWANAEDIFTYEDTNLVGSGPFIYSAERSGNGSIAFVKNENYWGEVPKLDVLVFTEYDNGDAMAEAIKLGEVDGCYLLQKEQMDTLADAEGIEVGNYNTFDFEYIGYNMLDELLSDKTIRQAMDYCTDKERIIEMSYSGLGQIAYGPVNNEGFIYTPSEKRDFSIDQANKLLDKAGYVDTNGDGIREKNGKQLSFEVITASERSSWQSATINILISDCEKAGIEIKWNPMEMTTMWDTCYDGNEDWQICIDGWGGDADPAFIMCIFEDWETSGYAGVSYSNPEFDKYYDLVKTTVDTKKRAEYIEKCQEILYEDCPYTFLCLSERVQAVNTAKWKNIEANSMGYFGNGLYTNYCNVTPAE